MKNKGDQGYMLYARNKNNMCNIAYRTFYPVVAKTAVAPGTLLFNLIGHINFKI